MNAKLIIAFLVAALAIIGCAAMPGDMEYRPSPRTRASWTSVESCAGAINMDCSSCCHKFGKKVLGEVWDSKWEVCQCQ